MENIFFTGDRVLFDIRPIHVGKDVCEPSHRYGPNIRNHFLIHYVESGKGRFITENSEYNLSSGDMFFISPGELTVYEADEKDPWTYKWIGFECAFDISDIFCENVVSSEKCEIFFSEILESEKYGDDAEYFACGKIFELIATLRKRLAMHGKREHSYAQRAKNYIETNYYKDITIAGLAAEMGLDRSYLSTVFREFTGKSPKEYLVDFRLKNAADLMTIYDFSPKQAAASCGYDDIFNFSKMFKKKYGVSPREYKAAKKR